MKKKFKDLTNTYFPDIEADKFQEWKKNYDYI